MENIKESNQNNDKEITLKEIILKIRGLYQYLLTRWRLILLFVICGGILGSVYSYFKKPVYTAVTTFVLEEGEKSGGLGQYAGIASMVGLDLGGGGGGIFQGDNILELYKSRTMIEKTLLTEITYGNKKQLLVDLYIDFNELKKTWENNKELYNLHFNVNNSSSGANIRSRLQDSILGNIIKDINKNYLVVSKPDKKLSIINVKVNAENENFAKEFDEEIVKNVNDFYIQTKTKKSLANVAIMQSKTDSVRRVMNSAIYVGAAAVDATPNLNVTRQVQRNAPVQRSQFNIETNKAVLAELIKNLELSKITLSKETPLIQVVDHPINPLEVDKLSLKKGFAYGAFLVGFLTVLILIIRRLFSQIFI